MKPISAWLPRSLFARLLLVMLTGISLAQLSTSLIWAGQVSSDSRARITENAQYLAVSLAATMRYFQALPDNVRPIVIEQQREVGGSGLFISVNQARLPVEPQLKDPLRAPLLDAIQAQLRTEVDQPVELALAMPSAVRLYDERVPIAEIPVRWIRQSLVLEPDPAPILVAQVPLDNGHWLYLATLMPDPYILDRDRGLAPERWWSLGATLVVVGVLCFLFVRWQTRPLRRLAEAADAFGRGLEKTPVQASGMRELDATAEAFEAMKLRIQRYLDDRERLFAAISHDLRTPITRLRIQAELIDDEALRASLDEDLEELEMMVKGALQTVRDTDIHEDPRPVDLGALLLKIAGERRVAAQAVSVTIADSVDYVGKPLALKRCLSNLIDNAIHYGDRAEVSLAVVGDSVEIRIRDHGPGLPDDGLERLFKPYSRLAHGRARNAGGMGLGLGIAQSIVHAHGGELLLANHPAGGLCVRVRLPLIYALRRL